MKTIKKQIGFIGIDSGQVLLCDPCYIDSHWHHPTEEESLDYDFEKKKFKGQFSYAGCANASLNENQGGQLNYDKKNEGAGVVCTTGWGDGCYPVYAYYKEGRITKVEINFI